MQSSAYNSINNILVIIPVRNEEVTIASVILNLQHYGFKQIKIVDNSSSDL